MPQVLGTASSRLIRSLAGHQLPSLVGTAFLCIGISCFAVRPALPFASAPVPDSSLAAQPVRQVQAESGARPAPFTELTKTLANARHRLEELSTLTKKAAAGKSEFDALRARERKMLVDLRVVHADRNQLRNARDASIARAEDLDKALEQVTAISQALVNRLAAERQEKSQSRAREAQLAAQLDSLNSDRARAEADIALLRGRLEDAQERLADATQERVRAEARLVELEARSSEDEQRIPALQAQIYALQEELKAKDGALEGLASLHTERGELRQRLAATEAELKRKKDENDQLSSELIVFRSAARAATDVAQQHLLTVEDKIRELNEAAVLTSPSDPQSSREAKAPASGSRAVGDLLDARVAAPGASEKGRTDSYKLIAPAQAADEYSDSSLQIRIRDALRQQREQLQGLMKELDDKGREGVR